jgi:hypothetical protein
MAADAETIAQQQVALDGLGAAQRLLERDFLNACAVSHRP